MQESYGETLLPAQRSDPSCGAVKVSAAAHALSAHHPPGRRDHHLQHANNHVLPGGGCSFVE